MFKLANPVFLCHACLSIDQTDRGRLERIFKQRQGGIVKASKEQIQALGHGEEGGHGGGGLWPFPTGGSSGPFNIFDKGPVKRNNYGQLFEAKPKDSEQLRDLDLTVSLANISRVYLSPRIPNQICL